LTGFVDRQNPAKLERLKNPGPGRPGGTKALPGARARSGAGRDAEHHEATREVEKLSSVEPGPSGDHKRANNREGAAEGENGKVDFWLCWLCTFTG